MTNKLCTAILFGICFIPVHHPTPPPVYIPPVIPPIVVVIPPVIPIMPPTVSVVPQVTTSVSNSNNGQAWCSGPSAPGWNVSLPNGGCKPTQCVPITNFQVKNIIKGDGFVDLFWTGSGYVNIWNKNNGKISHVYTKSTGYYNFKGTGDFWISNECSKTSVIDP